MPMIIIPNSPRNTDHYRKRDHKLKYQYAND